MYQIYTVIDPTTGEVLRYTPDLAPQVVELVAARRAQLAERLRGLGQERLRFVADLSDKPGDALAREFFEMSEL
jgi:hypothetical protein